MKISAMTANIRNDVLNFLIVVFPPQCEIVT